MSRSIPFYWKAVAGQLTAADISAPVHGPVDVSEGFGEVYDRVQARVWKPGALISIIDETLALENQSRRLATELSL